ncbi:heme peroxidase, plant/fungal/bacterial [Sesbania bispinosa]|nr:heme peroxidase, plant/fungal/bacterial [Sesbania bispinosa]
MQVLIFSQLEDLKVVDEIKKAVDEACGRPILGGPTWEVQLGRRDSTTAAVMLQIKTFHNPFFSLSQLIDIFKSHGLDEKDLVVLSLEPTVLDFHVVLRLGTVSTMTLTSIPTLHDRLDTYVQELEWTLTCSFGPNSCQV